jgi:hypothetical protein
MIFFAPYGTLPLFHSARKLHSFEHSTLLVLPQSEQRLQDNLSAITGLTDFAEIAPFSVWLGTNISYKFCGYRNTSLNLSIAN